MRTRLRGPKLARLAESGDEEWLRIRVILPIACKPLWDEIQAQLRELEIVHHNKGVEAGMHVEILMAEYLAGLRIPRPEGWTETVD